MLLDLLWQRWYKSNKGCWSEFCITLTFKVYKSPVWGLSHMPILYIYSGRCLLQSLGLKVCSFYLCLVRYISLSLIYVNVFCNRMVDQVPTF